MPAATDRLQVGDAGRAAMPSRATGWMWSRSARRIGVVPSGSRTPVSRAQIASRSQRGGTFVFCPTPMTSPASSSTIVRRSAPRSSTSRCSVAVETFIRPPASVCNSHPGVRVSSSNASRSMVASSSGRGASQRRSSSGHVPARSPLAQRHQPVGQRRPVTTDQRPTPVVQLVERSVHRLGVGQVLGDGDRRTQWGVQRLRDRGEPDGVELAVQAAAPEQVRGQLQERLPLGRGLGLLQTATADERRPSPRRPRPSASGSQSRCATIAPPTSRSSSPRASHADRRAARQIAATCDHDSHRSASPASVAGIDRAPPPRPSTSRASRGCSEPGAAATRAGSSRR